MEEKPDTVRIECSHMGGLMLSLFRHGRGDLGEPMVVRGVGVRLNGPSGVMGGTNSGAEGVPGITEVDAKWWAEWVSQNEGKNPLLDQGIIREWKENPTS